MNVIPKLRKLIVKIRASPQRKERFNRQSNLYSTNSLNLILDVKTRWNSTYLMLERALKLQEVSNFVNIIYICELKQSIYKFVFISLLTILLDSNMIYINFRFQMMNGTL
jgi:hypothetical protein